MFFKRELKSFLLLWGFVFVFFSCAGGAAYKEAPAQAAAPLNAEARSGDEPETRMISYSVSLSLVVKDVDESKKTVLAEIKNHEGYIIKESTYYVTTRIPAARMDNFIAAVKKTGRVENEVKTGTDITEKYRDDVIRLESLKNVRDRYQALLEKANEVNEILNIEKELERVNTEIEILEGKKKYAELSVSYSNINVSFEEKTKPGPAGWIFYGLYRGIKWLFVRN